LFDAAFAEVFFETIKKFLDRATRRPFVLFPKPKCMNRHA
jgi:hypothetical protein